MHGQTVRHRPQEGWTLQINNPARVAEHAYMTVVADFRMRDIAAGGQGAPLVPAFHAALFARPGRARVVANIGGIANVTILPARGDVRGFDTGPGNVLLDLASQRHLDEPYDDGGAWGATGAVDAALLASLLAEPYFAAPPPKSTGRDLFNAGWLDARLLAAGWRGRAQDLQATLTQLTARSLADAVRAHAAGSEELLVCGGGAQNARAAARARGRAAGRARRARPTADGVATRSRRGARVRVARARSAGRAAGQSACGDRRVRAPGAGRDLSALGRHHRRRRGRAAA